MSDLPRKALKKEKQSKTKFELNKRKTKYKLHKSIRETTNEKRSSGQNKTTLHGVTLFRISFKSYILKKVQKNPRKTPREIP